MNGVRDWNGSPENALAIAIGRIAPRRDMVRNRLLRPACGHGSMRNRRGDNSRDENLESNGLTVYGIQVGKVECSGQVSR